MRLVFLLALLASPAFAQNLSTDPDFVWACHEHSELGAESPDCLGEAANNCQLEPGGSTTAGIAACLNSEAATWDAILNDEYGLARAGFRERDASEGTELAASLLTAQRAWLAFRDAECALSYSVWGNGSMREVAYSGCIMAMTANRARVLRDMRAP